MVVDLFDNNVCTLLDPNNKFDIHKTLKLLIITGVNKSKIIKAIELVIILE